MDRSQWQKQFCLDHKPDEFETSPTGYVIERKDFEEIKFTVQPDEGDPYEVTERWEYLERWIPKEQWIADQIVTIKQDIQASNENDMAIFGGMADLYELQLESLGE